MKNSKNIFVNALALSMALFSCMNNQLHAHIQESSACMSSYSYVTPLTLGKAALFTAAAGGISYATIWTVTLMHELGHALPRTLVGDTSVAIVMGSHNEYDTTMYTIPSIGIVPPMYIKSLNPFIGCIVDTSATATESSRIRKSICYVGGPLLGAVVSYFLVKSFSQLAHYCGQKDNGGAALFLLLGTATSLNFGVELANLIPMHHLFSGIASDGYLLARDVLKIPEKKLDRIEILGRMTAISLPVASVAYFLYSAVKG